VVVVLVSRGVTTSQEDHTGLSNIHVTQQVSHTPPQLPTLGARC
jgi:hypothetical protein